MGLITISPKINYENLRGLGFLGQENIAASEIKAEIAGRGYLRGTSPTATPSITYVSTMARISRSEAISSAVTEALRQQGFSQYCNQVGGCYINPTTFDTIVIYATDLANMYYMRGYAGTPSYTTIAMPEAYYSPVAKLPETIVYSPSYYSPVASPVAVPSWASVIAMRSGFVTPISPSSPSYFEGFGQVATAPSGVPAMSTSEKVSLVLNIVSAGAKAGADYYTAKAYREQLQALGQQIPSLTAAELEAVLQKYKLLNPDADMSALDQLAAGVLGKEKPTEKKNEWILPVAIGAGALVLVLISKKRQT